MVGMFRAGRIACGFSLVTACCVISAVQAHADDALPAKVAGAAAWKGIVGNTVVAKSKSGDYTEFYGADGAVQHVDGEGKSKGTWTLQGDKVCFDYAEEDDHSCVTLEVTGAKGVFIDEDGAKDLFDILPGNAKNL